MTYIGENVLNKLEREGSQAPEKKYKDIIRWRNVGILTFIHVGALIGAHLMAKEAKWQTIIWTIFLYEISAIGIVAGQHRLWTHNSYKVKMPLELLLAFFATVAAETSIYNWARDHRVHHKYTDTDADPHNATRGFFYSHIGWLLYKKNPLVIEKGKTIFLDDLHANPIVMSQHRYYYRIAIPLSMIITLVPMYFWEETLMSSFFVGVMLRYCFTIHMTFLINSAAHMFGTRPYDKNINPTENWLVSLGNIGDGWHNFHHAFPWDYRSAELGGFRFNLAALFIELMAKLGQAYDLKTASPHIVLARQKRTGMLSTTQGNTKIETIHSWGYGDKTRPYEESCLSMKNDPSC
ncbi:unnamed protein product [Nezara viridula]|uniref:Fatty acid desaturase domain-containing protein n=1 Tax=Nezara viridula TaxID=85310 RepID=A0A9P0E2Y4_NEZVI|nr:unnamed protein product [Nezara viridula]